MTGILPLLRRAFVFGALAAALASCTGGAKAKRVFILGIDGMDPKLLQRFADEGRLPHFKQLMDEGDFKPLQTTMPPLESGRLVDLHHGYGPGRPRYLRLHSPRSKDDVARVCHVTTVDSDWNIPLGDWIIPSPVAR